MRRVEQVSGAVTDHGEGPVWSARWGGLRFVDMLAGGVLTLREDGTVDRLDVGRVAAFVRPRRGGGYVVATERGLGLAPGADALPRHAIDLVRAADERMNEGTVAPDGSLYAGSTTWDQRPGGGALYRVSPGLVPELVLTGVTISNGLDFSPDHARAYYVDSGAGRMDVFDVVDARLTDRRPLVTLPRDVGDLDGIAVDAEGTVWVAVYGAGAVHRYSPSGGLLEVVELPVPHVTACAFGGPTLQHLYITTSRGGAGDRAPTGAGAVFVTESDVPGLPVREFAG